ncbi:MAG: hypothetical protein HY787_12650 [Deltaproteobacteria bacterium]|nr:hypothetical protein [Deltaproteobacteria bacterium]
MQSGKKNIDYGLTIRGRFGEASFGQAYARLMTTGAVTRYLPWVVDLQKALDILLLGEPDAQEAYRD